MTDTPRDTKQGNSSRSNSSIVLVRSNSTGALDRVGGSIINRNKLTELYNDSRKKHSEEKQKKIKNKGKKEKAVCLVNAVFPDKKLCPDDCQYRHGPFSDEEALEALRTAGGPSFNVLKAAREKLESEEMCIVNSILGQGGCRNAGYCKRQHGEFSASKTLNALRNAPVGTFRLLANSAYGREDILKRFYEVDRVIPEQRLESFLPGTSGYDKPKTMAWAIAAKALGD